METKYIKIRKENIVGGIKNILKEYNNSDKYIVSDSSLKIDNNMIHFSKAEIIEDLLRIFIIGNGDISYMFLAY